MSGLRRICKMYGAMTIQGVEWVWDYATDEPRIKSEMTKEQLEASERAKWTGVKQAEK
jgi:hypothetical protein